MEEKELKDLKCSLCSKSFLNKRTLEKHKKEKICLKQIEKRRFMPHKCEFCISSFEKRKSLLRHLRNCSAKNNAILRKVSSEKPCEEIEVIEDDNKCQEAVLCDEKEVPNDDNNESLDENHVEKMNTLDEINSDKVENVNNNSSNIVEFVQSSPHECQHCHHLFTRKSSLNAHVKHKVCLKKLEDATNRGFKCSYCPSSFKEKNAFTRHCQSCPKALKPQANFVPIDKPSGQEFVLQATDLPWCRNTLNNPILNRLVKDFQTFLEETKIRGCPIFKSHQRCDLKDSTSTNMVSRLKTFFKWIELKKENVWNELQVVRAVLEQHIIFEFRHEIIINHSQTYSNSANYIQTILRFSAHLYNQKAKYKKYQYTKAEDFSLCYDQIYSLWMLERSKSKKETELRRSRDTLEKHGLFVEWNVIMAKMEEEKEKITCILEKAVGTSSLPPTRELNQLRNWLAVSLFTYIPPKRTQLLNPILREEFPEETKVGTKDVLCVMIYDEQSGRYLTKTYNTKGEYNLDSSRLKHFAIPHDISKLFKMYIESIRSKFEGAKDSDRLFFNQDMKKERSEGLLSTDCKKLIGINVQSLRLSFESYIVKLQKLGLISEEVGDILSLACQHEFKVRDKHYRKPHQTELYMIVTNAMNTFNKAMEKCNETIDQNQLQNMNDEESAAIENEFNAQSSPVNDSPDENEPPKEAEEVEMVEKEKINDIVSDSGNNGYTRQKQVQQKKRKQKKNTRTSKRRKKSQTSFIDQILENMTDDEINHNEQSVHQKNKENDLNEEDEEDIYEVETILDKKKKSGTIFYLVKWKNYSITESTWEPLENMSGSRKLISEFELSKSNLGKIT